MSFGKTVKPNSLFGQSNQGGNQQQNSSLFGGQTTPHSTNSVFGGQTTNSVFGGLTTQPTNSLFGAQQQSTNSVVGGQTTQPTNSLFGVQQPSTNSLFGGQTNPPSTLLNEQVAPQFGAQNLIIQTISELSRKIDALSEQVRNLSLPPSTSNNEKKLYIACNHHEHLLYETTPEKITGLLNSQPSTLIEKNSYINGFKCDVCCVDYKPATHMYHCEMCEQTNKLYDICENCIRKSLKLV